MTDGQKEFLLAGWINLPTSEEINYQHRRKSTIEMSSTDRGAMAQAGYSPDQIKRLEQELKKAESNA